MYTQKPWNLHAGVKVMLIQISSCLNQHVQEAPLEKLSFDRFQSCPCHQAGANYLLLPVSVSRSLKIAWSLDLRGPLLRFSIRLIRRMDPERSPSMQAHQRKSIEVGRIRPSKPANIIISHFSPSSCISQQDHRKPTPPAAHTQTPAPGSHTRRPPYAAPSPP